MRSLFLLFTMMSGSIHTGAAQHLDDLTGHNGWFASGNAAGLSAMPDSLRLTDASVSYRFGEGGWTDYSDPKRSISWRGGVRSLYRLNSRTAMSGSASYSYRLGYDMAGSAWIDPTNQPFDIIAYSDGQAGRTVLERYQLSGAFSHDAGAFSLGLSARYETANYAKQRDLRHQNRLMHLHLSPGIIWHRSVFDLGLSYSFSRSIEGISFNVEGNTDRQHISLISYGAFLGLREYSATVYDGYSSVSSGDRPIVDQRHGVSLQAQVKRNNRQWHNELNWQHRSGYYGRETSYTIVYEDHDGNLYAWASSLGMIPLSDGLWRHHITLGLNYGTLCAKERLWNEVQQGGGFTEYVYYDHQPRLNRKTLSASLAYQWRPSSWIVDASLNYCLRDQRVSYYPVYRDQKIFRCQLGLNASRRWLCNDHRWEAGLGLEWQRGGGYMAKDGTYDGGVASSRVVSHDGYLRQSFLYQTASQTGLSLQLRYATPRGVYFLMHHHFQHAYTRDSFKNNSFYTISLTSGYEF